MSKDTRPRRAARRYWSAKPKPRRSAVAGSDGAVEASLTIAPDRRPVAVTLGPYETTYDIRRGYDEETRPVQP